MKCPKVPTVVLLYFSELRIFAIYQTTDVFPFVPVTAIVLKGRLLWSLLNNEYVSKLILDTTNWGIFKFFIYLFEIIAGILFLSASSK